jgi:rhodanese-related sulfurtransferase
MIRRSLILTALLLAPLAGGAQQPPAAEADAAQLKGWLQAGKKLTLVDSRSDAEYAAAHIPGALGIPAERTREEGWRLPTDKTVPVIFYCRGPG